MNMDHLGSLSEAPLDMEHSYDRSLHQVAIQTDRKSALVVAGDAVVPCQHTAKYYCHIGIYPAGDKAWVGIGTRSVSGVQRNQPTTGVEYELGPLPERDSRTICVLSDTSTQDC